jgi:hypothetical protein
MTIYYFNQFSLLSFAPTSCLFLYHFVVLPLGTLALLCVRLWDPGARLLAHITELLNDAPRCGVDK